MKIGFIGTGVMGTGIVTNLLKHHEDVTVYNRTKAHAQPVLDQGAQWADSPASLAQDNDIVMTMVGFPKDVKEVYYGEQGIFQAAHAGQYLVDMTTSSPALDQKISQTAEKIGAHALDTPVSGGDIGAKNGQLTVMVGGKQSDLAALQPVFAEFSKAVHYFGPAGAG